ncbi:hypothetical protein WMY93_005444 [Mugilogobius chulae]|uniref:Uncharacterized protein n=1 Tax=Mugilogobius chulae TaxID=88201 RepID=A0AAW0PSM0_9GOBI
MSGAAHRCQQNQLHSAESSAESAESQHGILAANHHNSEPHLSHITESHASGLAALEPEVRISELSAASQLQLSPHLSPRLSRISARISAALSASHPHLPISAASQPAFSAASQPASQPHLSISSRISAASQPDLRRHLSRICAAFSPSAESQPHLSRIQPVIRSISGRMLAHLSVSQAASPAHNSHTSAANFSRSSSI